MTCLQTSSTVLICVEFSERLPLVQSSVIIAIIMLLKAHLKILYGITEEYVMTPFVVSILLTFSRIACRKCSKWVMGKKSAVGDRPAARRHEKPLLWDRLPFATAPILTDQDLSGQRDIVSSQPCLLVSDGDKSL